MDDHVKWFRDSAGCWRRDEETEHTIANILRYGPRTEEEAALFAAYRAGIAKRKAD